MRLPASVDSYRRNQVPGLNPNGESPERVETSVTAPSGPSRVRGSFYSDRPDLRLAAVHPGGGTLLEPCLLFEHDRDGLIPLRDMGTVH